MNKITILNDAEKLCIVGGEKSCPDRCPDSCLHENLTLNNTQYWDVAEPTDWLGRALLGEMIVLTTLSMVGCYTIGGWIKKCMHKHKA